MKNQDELIKIAKSARATDFPFSDSKLASILDNVDSANPRPRAKLKGKTKMASIGLTLTGAMFGLWALMPHSEPATNKQSSSIKDNIAIENTDNSISATSTKSLSVNSTKLTNTEFPAISFNADLPEITSQNDFAELLEPTKPDNGGTNNKFNTPAIETSSSPLYFDIRTDDADDSPIKFESGKTLENNLMPIIYLTKEELTKLNIFQNDCGISYLVEETYPPYVFEREDAEAELKAKGYMPAKGVLKQMNYMFMGMKQATLLPYDNENIKTTLGIYPVNTQYLLKSDNASSSGTSASGRATQKQKSGGFDCNLATRKFYELLNKLNKRKSDLAKYPAINVNVPKNIYENFQSYYIVMSADINDKTCKFALFTFPATSNFISLLPERYKKLEARDANFEDNYIKSDSSTISNKMQAYLANLDTCPSKVHNEFEDLDKKTAPPNISHAGRITLSNEELAKLGVIVQGSTVKYLSEEKQAVADLPEKAKDYIKSAFAYNLDKEYVLLKSYSVMDVCDAGESKDEPIKYTGWDYDKYSKTSPIGFWAHSTSFSMPTNEQLKENAQLKMNKFLKTSSRMFQSPMMKDLFKTDYVDDAKLVYTDNNKVYIPKISKIIPIRITNNCSGATESVLDLFFYLNKEFVALMPDRYKDKLDKELEIADRLNEGKIGVREACQAIKGQESYLGLCELSSSTILNANVIPNPASVSNLNVDIELSQDSKINIDLYNLNGELVARLANSKELKKGVNKFKLESKNASVFEGLYILTFSNETGERVTRNIIIR